MAKVSERADGSQWIGWEALPEETFVVLGGSRYGKNYCLNILIGVLEPASSQVRIFGQDLHRLKGAQLKELHIRCGMLFQSEPYLVLSSTRRVLLCAAWQRTLMFLLFLSL